MPAETMPVAGSVRMSARLSFSSTKNGPSVRAAVKTQVALPLEADDPLLSVVEDVSVALVPLDAQAARSECDTTTRAAPFAANPSKSRRLRRVGVGEKVSRSLLVIVASEERVDRCQGVSSPTP